MAAPLPSSLRPTVSSLRTMLHHAWSINPSLTFVGVLMLATLAATVVGMLVDPRIITGAPAWVKPAKFAISISIYCFTLLWLLTYVRGHPRLVRLVSWTTAVALGIEMLLIAGAAAAGTTSHFNVGSPVSSAVWSTMGTAIVVTWLMNLVTMVLLLIQRLPDLVLARSLQLGLVISAVGMAVAFFMTAPTSAQLAAADDGGEMPIVGAHSVDVDDGGPGLPLVNWSTEGGDLRVGHFVGLHALQLLPLTGFLLTRCSPRWLRSGHRVALVWTVGIAYLGLVVLLTWQALRGQPVVAPDALTVTALATLFAAAGASATVIVLHARRGQHVSV